MVSVFQVKLEGRNDGDLRDEGRSRALSAAVMGILGNETFSLLCDELERSTCIETYE